MTVFWIIIVLLTFLAIFCVAKPLITDSKSGTFEFKSNYLVIIITAVFICAAGLGLYSQWGRSADVADSLTKEKNATVVKAAITKYGSRQNIIIALRQKLEHLPFNVEQAKGWYILGKLYFNDQQYPAAVEAFTKAVQLKPNESDYILQLVSVKFLIKHRFDNEDLRLIDQLLKQDPKNFNVINLLALNAYQQENYSVAIRYWEELLNFFPPNSEDAKALLEMIRQGQQHLAAKTSPVRIKVAVKLAKQFQSLINPNDIVFVYALNAQGPKMPLAVIKTTASKLPLDVTLDDANSMVAGRTLSSAKQITIEARVSHSGNPLPTRGDLVGKTPIVDIESQKKKLITISIDHKME